MKNYKSSIQAMPEGVFCCNREEHRLEGCADGAFSSESPTLFKLIMAIVFYFLMGINIQEF
jgi:hypothetical protein